MPLVACTVSPAIHHADTGIVRTASRKTAFAARRSVTSLATHTAWTSHSAGASPTSNRAVALTLPQVATVSANSAG
jgi:hypothetical protein